MRDALSERLFATGVFDTMVERAALDRALAEIRLQRTVSTAGSSEFDQSTVISAAHLQGANIVILGTAEVVGDQCHFTARMIRVDDATILAIASADTALTDEHVARGCSDESSPTAVGTGASVTTTPAPVAPLYDESLSGVREGQLPAAWIGAANLMMRLENGRRAVAFFQGDRDSFTVPDITWPDNYRLRIRVHLPNREPELVVTIGSVRCRLSGGPFDGQNGIRINETVAPTADLRGTEVLFEIVRQGDVVRALANGVGGPLVRVPSDPDARGMTVTLGAWNEAGATVSEWRLYSISVEAVPPAR